MESLLVIVNELADTIGSAVREAHYEKLKAEKRERQDRELAYWTRKNEELKRIQSDVKAGKYINFRSW